MGGGNLAVRAHEHVDVLALGGFDVGGEVVHVAGGVLHALDVVDLGDARHDLGREVGARGLGNVVHEHGNLDALGDSLVVALDLGVGDLHEVGVDDRDG